ncbi:MAG: hypothetical protein OXE95_12770 [Chloroflexi bacterium]|nr:hypothetical protein [Chloroflexota bacterium]MCY4248434.1 hypothetical protein [Chloroflexota bacterium]
MTPSDLASVALDALQPAANKKPSRQDRPLAERLRAKIIGVLLRKARLAAERAPEECAAFLTMTTEQFMAWETGEKAPSLPELELLSRFLQGAPTPARQSDYLLLRQRIIGVLLQKARMKADADAAQAIVPPERLRAYELGERSMPMTDLCALAQALSIELGAFQYASEPERPFAAPSPAQATAASAVAATDFAADRQNAAFIRLAMAFRHINVDDLHRIADALLAIINARAERDLAESNAAS